MPMLGVKNPRKWTLKNLRKEAKKYKIRSQFQAKNRAAYMAAYFAGHLEEVTRHMPKRQFNRFVTKKTDISFLLSRAMRYKNMWRFMRSERGAYYAMLRDPKAYRLIVRFFKAKRPVDKKRRKR